MVTWFLGGDVELTIPQWIIIRETEWRQRQDMLQRQGPNYLLPPKRPHLPIPPRHNQSIAEVRALTHPSPCTIGPSGLGESLYQISLLVDTAHPNNNDKF